jgi:hypothetical protein
VVSVPEMMFLLYGCEYISLPDILPEKYFELPKMLHQWHKLADE